MTPQIMRILKKLYHYENRYFNVQEEPCYSEAILSEKEKALLHAYGWKTNDIAAFSCHADVITLLQTLKDHPQLTKKRCMDTFVAGIGGRYPRGLSVLPAWYYLTCCPNHFYEERPQYACCWICGDMDEYICVNNSEFQYCLYSGNAYSSTPLYAYLNLNYLKEIPAVAPTKDDIITLSAFLDLFRTAPAGETPGAFEKRLRDAKIMRGDSHTRRGVLNSLAMVGVIPNRFIPLSNQTWTNFGDITLCESQLNNTKGRSEIGMPWAGWIGSLKLDEKRAAELFGDYWTVFAGS